MGYVEPDAGEVATVVMVPRVSGSVRITVFSLRGEVVFEMGGAVEMDTENLFEWDCRNKDGQVVASGVYAIKVEGAGMSEMLKVAVVR
jgi:flagellar hook assembly protein FlgD